MKAPFRRKRKGEHVACALKAPLSRADFSDLNLVHNCLPEKDLGEVELETVLAGTRMRSPLFINALTGGTEDTAKINRSLARVAREGGYALAVGSQMAGVREPETAFSFEVVREEHPDGIIWANLGAYADLKTARRAVDMIQAQGLQIHLNVPQELAMKEGDCSFRGALARIANLCENLEVPVMVKEVGFGIAAEQARALERAGISALDVGGRGGTNFARLEAMRRKRPASRIPGDWGLATPVTLLEALSAVGRNIDVMASGGVNHGLNMAKALALGARAVGIAGLALKILCRHGEKALLKHLQRLEKELRLVMLMTGSANLEQFQKVPVVITGFTAEWMQRRGIDVSRWAGGGPRF